MRKFNSILAVVVVGKMESLESLNPLQYIMNVFQRLPGTEVIILYRLVSLVIVDMFQAFILAYLAR